jgi:hypothetical protein
MQYYTQGVITLEDALANCSSPTEFDLRVKGIHASSDQTWNDFEKLKEHAPADKVTGMSKI